MFRKQRNRNSLRIRKSQCLKNKDMECEALQERHSAAAQWEEAREEALEEAMGQEAALEAEAGLGQEIPEAGLSEEEWECAKAMEEAILFREAGQALQKTILKAILKTTAKQALQEKKALARKKGSNSLQ